MTSKIRQIRGKFGEFEGFIVRLAFIILSISLFLSNWSFAAELVKPEIRYRYWSYLPADYEKDESKKWPLIISLHGGSSRGDKWEDLEKIKRLGIPKLISTGNKFNFVIIAPQCPQYKNWAKHNWFPLLFKEISGKLRIDKNRVYLTGYSLGGEGTWYIAEQYPEIIAAIAPVCANSSFIKSIRKDIRKIETMPVWIFHGEKDMYYRVNESDEMYELLSKINKNVKYTRFPDTGHVEAVDKTYENSKLYQWFLTHSKQP